MLVPESHEASALGAAAVALYAVGKIDSLEEVKDWIDIVHHHVPNKEKYGYIFRNVLYV